MRTKTTTTLVILSILFMLACAAFALLSVTIHKKSIELTTILQTIRNEQVMFSDQDTLVSLLSITEADREELQSYIIADENSTIDFLSEVDLLASNLGIALETNRLEVVKGGRKPYDALTVTFAFSGSDEAVRRFIQALENIPYTGELTAIQLTKRPESSEKPASIEGTVTLLLSVTSI